MVLKIGSSSLTRPDGGLDLNRIDVISALVAGLRRRRHDVVLVASGAVAAGLPTLGLAQRPTELRLLQAAASVGQSRIMGRWEASMSVHGLVAAQVLLTAHDVAVRDHYRTVRETFDALLSMGAVPVVNENDAVANTEFNLGDNDHLAALVSHLVAADLLILLTDVDGLWTARPGSAGASPIRLVTDPARLAAVDVTGRGSSLGTGGMRTKVQAATLACSSGTATIIASAADAVEVLGGQQVPADKGTWFLPTGPHRPSRRLWMAHASLPQGRVLVDDGAARAVTVGKKSLLLPGVVGVDGEFESGSVIEVVGAAGLLARGICRYSAADLREVLAARRDGAPAPDHVTPVIHRDDLAELPRTAQG
ncbi:MULTISPECIES: glutamate 5-kinase [unclassified Actinomyces]|uniref:glutamate 5-kinase n=1 Tax=unclassified Actinomyces TaxID=2609248 RepID=UPI0020173B91|nr:MULTISPECIES: glutamate 5-kinase [unclassified Actinomyces]MCL3776639.1 glutamate 5-kinase [Actinomyces sp. AC-20-1]MCL3790508.1 glutamate 5-kinase [Actinomyces sp. 187325]MCL3791918.1 glutamate 5-kinase [Actinomyces sp. 186855]MCL3795257.1 glutamate 5-kinase [Actinomyces sp. 217892]